MNHILKYTSSNYITTFDLSLFNTPSMHLTFAIILLRWCFNSINAKWTESKPGQETEKTRKKKIYNKICNDLVWLVSKRGQYGAQRVGKIQVTYPPLVSMARMLPYHSPFFFFCYKEILSSMLIDFCLLEIDWQIMNRNAI